MIVIAIWVKLSLLIKMVVVVLRVIQAYVERSDMHSCKSYLLQVTNFLSKIVFSSVGLLFTSS